MYITVLPGKNSEKSRGYLIYLFLKSNQARLNVQPEESGYFLGFFRKIKLIYMITSELYGPTYFIALK